MEKVKNIAIFLVMIIGISFIGHLAWVKFVTQKFHYNITPGPIVNAKSDIVIEGPKEIKIGQLARLDVTKSAGKTFKWQILPSGVDFEVYDDGRKVIFSSGIPGDYTFIVACANDNDVDIKVLTIKVLPNDGSPIPGPVPPVPPSPVAGLKGQVIVWAGVVNSPNKKAEAAKLATSFLAIQASIKGGQLVTIEQIIEATKVANRESLGNSLQVWVPFLEQLQKYLQTQAEAGLLVTPEQHAQVWGEISEGLTIVSR